MKSELSSHRCLSSFSSSRERTTWDWFSRQLGLPPSACGFLHLPPHKPIPHHYSTIAYSLITCPCATQPPRRQFSHRPHAPALVSLPALRFLVSQGSAKACRGVSSVLFSFCWDTSLYPRVAFFFLSSRLPEMKVFKDVFTGDELCSDSYQQEAPMGDADLLDGEGLS